MPICIAKLERKEENVKEKGRKRKEKRRKVLLRKG
jgi:hypothetical protein